MLPSVGKMFLFLGGLFLLLGAIFLLAPQIPFLGRLPGDIHYEGKNVRVYFPWVTCLVLSVLLSLIFSLFRGWK